MPRPVHKRPERKECKKNAKGKHNYRVSFPLQLCLENTSWANYGTLKHHGEGYPCL